MVEGSGKEMSEDVVCEAVSLASKTVQPFLEALSEFQVKHGKQKREFKAFLASEELYSTVKRYCIGCVCVCVCAHACVRVCVHVCVWCRLVLCISAPLRTYMYIATQKTLECMRDPKFKIYFRAPYSFIPQ